MFTVENSSETKEQLIKIIRNESIGYIPWDMRTAMAVYGKNEWANSSLKTLLNENYINKKESFDYTFRNSSNANQTVTIPKGLSAEARGQIEEVKWYLGGSQTESNSGADYYKFERGKETCVTTGKCDSETRSTNMIAKVGLMYLSDYVYTYANGVDSKCYTNGYSYETNKGGAPTKGWLYNSFIQWAISPYTGDSNHAWRVDYLGYVLYDYVSFTDGVRPAIYLKSEIKTMGGDGSQENPYILE